LSKLFHRGLAYGRQEGVAVGEMPIGGVRNDPDHACNLAKDNRVRTP
jgi:hypothetical protein